MVQRVVAARTGLTALLLVVAIARAWWLRWTCDDAFVSFRYALNLVEGNGLVWNVGERVEGYTNLLWTLLMVPAIGLGLDPIAWSHVLGIVSLVAVAWGMWRLTPEGARPVGLWMFLLMGDVLVWATGGLETMTVAAFATVMAALLFSGGSLSGAAVCGVALVLTRPDGALLVAGIAGGWALITHTTSGDRIVAAVKTGGPALVAMLAVTVFRVAYYGEWLPNTYYAKSADVPWWDQGSRYVSLFFVRDWGIAVVATVALAAWLRGFRSRPALVLLVTAVVYVAYVARSGGDFMFARRLIPAVPLLLAALTVPMIPALAVIVALTSLAPLPTFDWWGDEQGLIDGIIQEDAFYTDEYVAEKRRQGEALGAALEGLETTLLLEGGLCMLAYYSELPSLIEGVGLTDYTIARAPLTSRGRPGHEKAPSPHYLDERAVSLIVLHATPPRTPTQVRIGDDLVLHVRRYDPGLMEALAARDGVEIVPIGAVIEIVARRMEADPCPGARRGLAFLDDYYFRAHPDDARRAPLVTRLERRCGTF